MSPVAEHSSVIDCPSCGTSIELDASARSALDVLVVQASDDRLRSALSEQEQMLAERARDQVELALSKAHTEHQRALLERDAALDAMRSSIELEVLKALQGPMRQLAEMQSALDSSRLMHEVQQQGLRERFEAQLAERDEAIARLRDMRLKLSTKMVGETLEQHCEAEFERVRSLAFGGDGTRVSFEKDNDARSGSKGDYVFREIDPSTGIELVSIMFEMKNEQTEGELVSAKHRNIEFLAKLDRDRREKGCEYAVLVSMLEPDSEIFNAGIVDMEHLFPKLYVVRPQFFLPILSLIRNSGRAAAAVRAELAALKSSEADLAAFETSLEAFKLAFGKNYESSTKHLDSSIEQIDRAVSILQRVRDSLVTSQRQMRLANDKAQDVSVRRLAKGVPSIVEQLG